MEIWKIIDGFGLNYMVSNTGLVKRSDTGVLLTGEVIKKGYRRIALSYEGFSKRFLVHRLVAEYFIGKSTLQVNHKDLDKLNNNDWNLEYVTSRQNKTHYALSTDKKLPVGVRLLRRKFQARINVKDKTFYLGVFDTPLLASTAYQNALKVYAN